MYPFSQKTGYTGLCSKFFFIFFFNTLVGNAEPAPQTVTPSVSGQNQELSGRETFVLNVHKLKKKGLYEQKQDFIFSYRFKYLLI